MKSLAPGFDVHPDTSLKEKIQRASRGLSRQAQWRLFYVGLIFVDALMIGLAFGLAYLFRFRLNLTFFHLNVTPLPSFYLNLVLFLIPVWLVIFAFLGLYDRQNLLGGNQEYALLFRGPTVGLLLVVVAGFLEQ